MANWARLQQAVNDMKRRAERERDALELADFLQGVANLEQYQDELEKQVDKLKAEKANWTNQADAVIKAANDQAAQIIGAARRDADECAREASDMKSNAAVTVEKMIADAKVQAQKMIDGAQAKVVSAQAELKIHLAGIDRAKEQADLKSEFLRGINDAIVAAAGKRDQLLQHIADLKAKFS